MSLDRNAVIAELRATEVAEHYDMRGVWRGRWLRSKVCPMQTHSSDAMGLSRDGMWHCWSCDEGGDLLGLIALAERLDIRADFGKVLEIAAGIAGMDAPDDDFGGDGKIARPPKPPREPPPLVMPLAQRVATARRRASWIWERLSVGRFIGGYLADRAIDPARVFAREEIKSTPLNIGNTDESRMPDLKRVVDMMKPLGIAVPVRDVKDGALVDIRVRRLDPRPNQPKVIGMLGGVVSEDATLVGCYGRPHEINSGTVIVVEGLADYLTALQLWPDADVYGATHAGVYQLVARHAAKMVAQWGSGQVVLVAQNDDPDSDDAAYRARTSVLDAKKDGAADRAVDRATKDVIDILGVRGVAWVECRPHKDLNDRWKAGDTIDVKEALAAIVADDDGW